MYYDWERPTDTLTLDIYPNGKSAYDLYEDDGLTRDHRQGIFATTRFEVNDNRPDGKPMEITINPVNGDYKGRLTHRVYLIEIHTSMVPKDIRVQGIKIKAERQEGKKAKSKGQKAQGVGGWSFNAGDRGGILSIRTGVVDTGSTTSITVH